MNKYNDSTVASNYDYLPDTETKPGEGCTYQYDEIGREIVRFEGGMPDRYIYYYHPSDKTPKLVATNLTSLGGIFLRGGKSVTDYDYVAFFPLREEEKVNRWKTSNEKPSFKEFEAIAKSIDPESAKKINIPSRDFFYKKEEEKDIITLQDKSEVGVLLLICPKQGIVEFKGESIPPVLSVVKEDVVDGKKQWTVELKKGYIIRSFYKDPGSGKYFPTMSWEKAIEFFNKELNYIPRKLEVSDEMMERAIRSIFKDSAKFYK